ncbi:MAG: hypothetical protein LLG04_13095 [Parachlamydia sp.]|nr:hypothetical protein [Parachlamydia sp.]
MDMQELLALNKEGLIPGPNETLEAFQERVQTTKEIFTTQTTAIPAHHWQWATEQLQALFDFAPRWCAANYSSKGLAPWQAAATWIYVKQVYSIQIRPSRWVFWLVNRNELLAHEAVHMARAAFNEPKTEELFAYLTSSAKWRQVIGPLFKNPRETLVFMAFIGAGSLWQIAEAVVDGFSFSSLCFGIAAILCAGWSLRLFHMRYRLAQAAKHLMPHLRNPTHVRAVLFRLTDREIIQLSTGRLPDSSPDMRWRLLRVAYFK